METAIILCKTECGKEANETFKCEYTSDYACGSKNLGYFCSGECLKLFQEKMKCQECGRIGKEFIFFNDKPYCKNLLWKKLSCYDKLRGLEYFYLCDKCRQVIEGGYRVGIFEICKTCFESSKYESNFNETKALSFENNK